MTHPYLDNAIFKPLKLKLVLAYIEKSSQNAAQRKLRHLKSERCRTLILDRSIIV